LDGAPRIALVARYIALIRKEPETAFGVSFPDLPGCVTAGSSLDEALAMAREALELHLEGLAAEGYEIPAARTLEAIMADRENVDAVAAVVEAATPRPPVERLNITLDQRLREAIDERARAEGMTRSGWIAAAARRAIEAERPRTAKRKRA
jgi:predicted RNase H-like HicB family nuclease